MLKLFVYGTLKRGYPNHARFCQGVRELRPAQVRGCLFQGPGYPFLEVPGEDILARGTAWPLADVATQVRLSKKVHAYPGPVAENSAEGTWGTVYGELLSFDDPEARLPAIDRLEGFRPEGRSLYRRVLVPAAVNGACEIAWAYTLATARDKGRRLVSGCWPE